MTRTNGVAVWSSSSWRDDAIAWLDARLAEAGRPRTGEVTQPRIRPWGTVLTAPTAAGPVWLKEPGPDTVFEVGLYDVLVKEAPSAVLRPLVVDVNGGRLLLPDGGPTLGDRLDGAELVDALAGVFPQYGQLQRDLVPHVDRLLALGISDMRPEIMPRRFDEAVEAAERYVRQRGGEDDRNALTQVVGMRDTFVSWCARLSQSAVGASIDHNDLHPWNVFPMPDGRAAFYDWGDSVVAHPFASMLVALRVVQATLEIAVDDPVIHRLRDAYLEPFGDLAPHAILVEELELACWVGKVARALTWDLAIRAQGDEAAEYAAAPFEWLMSLLGAS